MPIVRRIDDDPMVIYEETEAEHGVTVEAFVKGSADG